MVGVKEMAARAELLLNSDNPEDRRNAFRALVAYAHLYNDAEVARRLVRFLLQNVDELRWFLEEAQSLVPYLIEEINNDNAQTVVDVIVGTKSDEGIEALLHILRNHQSENVRLAAATGIWQAMSGICDAIEQLSDY